MSSHKQLCEDCGAVLDSRRALVEHRQLVHGAPRHECIVCGRAYTMQQTLTLHYRSAHPGEPLFKCRYCDEMFSEPGLRRQHEGSHIKGTVKQQRRDDGIYACDDCDKTYTDELSMTRHVRYHRQRRADAAALLPPQLHAVDAVDAVDQTPPILNFKEEAIESPYYHLDAMDPLAEWPPQ